MLIHEGEERPVRVDVWLAAILAAVAGAVNTAGFYAVGYYSANMTGNASALSDHLAFVNPGQALLFLAIILAFIAGASTSALLINSGRRRGIRAIYALSILAEAILLACLGAADLWLAAIHRSAILIIGLSFTMGLQNAAATRISNARVRTTHVSGMATDIGIELAVIFDMLRGREPKAGMPLTLSKLLLHALTVISFIVGGVAGVLLYDWAGGSLFLGTSVLLLVVSVPQVAKARLATWSG